MSRDLYKAFMTLSDSRKSEIMTKLGFTPNEPDYKGFIVWVRQQGKGLDLMWLIIDPMNPIDPRNIC